MRTDVLIKEGERVDDLHRKGYVIIQDPKRFCFGVDAVILSGFARVKKGEKVLSGENAFKLYDTYGFPIDLTSEILEEKGLSYDEEGFKKAQQEQRAKSEGTFGVHSMWGKDASV